LKFDHAYADGDEKYLYLPKNSRIRKVDVVALRNPDGSVPQVDLVEAKLLARGHSFDACVNQLDSIRDSGDRLWAGFAEDEWESLSDADRRRNEKKLSDHGCGLLLVSDGNCYPRIKAPQNADVTEDGRSEVLKQLGFAKDIFMPAAQTLGITEAKKAGGIMALTCMIADVLQELEHRKVNFQKYWGDAYDEDCVVGGWYVPNLDLSGKVFCELDPFGCFLGDGLPVAWVEVAITLEETYSRLERESDFGTHIFLENDRAEWRTIALSDGRNAIKYWADRGFTVGNLLHRIEILRRAREALRTNFESVIRDARKIRAG
jgi:hypothetical protein